MNAARAPETRLATPDRVHGLRRAGWRSAGTTEDGMVIMQRPTGGFRYRDDRDIEIEDLRDRVAALEKRMDDMSRRPAEPEKPRSRVRTSVELTADAAREMAAVIDAACAAFGVERRLLVSRRRGSDVLNARRAVYLLACRHTALLKKQIGAAVNVDHTTVICGERSAVKRLSADPEFAERYRAAEQRLTGRRS